MVTATDPVTGERGPRKVTDLIRHGGMHTMVAVQLAGTGRIDATDRHPFWVSSRRTWVNAIDLKSGDVVVTDRGDQVKVTNLTVSRQDLTAYNLTVADLHTYYVGQNPVLVHNASGPCPPNLSPIGAGRSGAFDQAKRDSGIPTSQSPSRVLPNLDRRGNAQPGRLYEFEVPAPGGGTRTVRIREDSAGHRFPDDPSQNRGPHFNTENGSHYDY